MVIHACSLWKATIESIEKMLEISVESSMRKLFNACIGIFTNKPIYQEVDALFFAEDLQKCNFKSNLHIRG